MRIYMYENPAGFRPAAMLPPRCLSAHVTDMDGVFLPPPSCSSLQIYTYGAREGITPVLQRFHSVGGRSPNSSEITAR